MSSTHCSQTPQRSSKDVASALKCSKFPIRSYPRASSKSRHVKLRTSLPAVVAQAQATSVVERAENTVPTSGRELQGVPELWKILSHQHGDTLALQDPHQSPPAAYTFREVYENIQQFGSGLAQLGLKQGDKVSLFSENSSRWLIADQSIMAIGAANAVRGSQSSLEEMGFIVRHSESCGVIVQDAKTLGRVLPALLQSSASQNGNGGSSPSLVGPSAGSDLSCPVLSFSQVLAQGRQRAFTPASIDNNDLATLVYTSGTTGSPKGVELTHANLLYQIASLPHYLSVAPGERTLSLLPPWHIYERACGYYILSRAGSLVYTSIRKFKDDLTNYPPDHFVCVPLVLDNLHTRVMQTLRKGSAVKRNLALALLSVSAAFVRARRILQGVALQYARRPRPALALLRALLSCAALFPLHKLGQLLVYKKIRQALGIRKTVVCGGGSLAAHLDDFYEVIGLEVLNGWGLTETAPVLSCRQSLLGPNVKGSVGAIIPGTTLKVVDPETLHQLPEGHLGLILAQGPGVMRGYFRDAASTEKAMKAGNRFFDTGDLGWIAPEGVAGSRMAGSVVLAGRSKDTIVLSNGENIEPQPIEDACCASSYISHMIVVGQDKRKLGALISPNQDAFKELEAVKGKMSEDEKVSVIKAEISKLTASRPTRERIANIVLLPKPLDSTDGTLTQTMKPRRPAIFDRYAKELAALNKALR